jgi:transcription elongation factor B subunit 1
MSKAVSPPGKSEFVTLESSDGYTFVVSRQIACASGTLRAMLDEDGQYNRSIEKLSLYSSDC